MMVDGLETRVALLEKDIAITSAMVGRLEIATEKISDVASNVAKILAVHDDRLLKNEKVQSDLFSLAESRRMEIQRELANVESHIIKINDDLTKEMEKSEARIVRAISSIVDSQESGAASAGAASDNIEKRMRALENWRWMLVGGGVVLGFLLGKVPSITEVIKASFIS